jgi:hypothetical protein
MRTRIPLGITSVRGFECSAHSPTALSTGGMTSAAPVPTVMPMAMLAPARFRDVGCHRR